MNTRHWSASEREAYKDKKERIRNEVKCMFRAGFSILSIRKKLNLTDLYVRRLRAELVKSGEIFSQSRRNIIIDNFCAAIAEKSLSEIAGVLEMVEQYKGVSLRKNIESNIKLETAALVRELFAVLAREREVRKREASDVKQG